MKHQHFIPRSYLRNFAEERNDKFFIDAKFLQSGTIKNNISVNDICVDKNIYTIPNAADDKYKLEKFYAENVDSAFPEVHRLLTNSSTTFVSPEQRQKIIYVTMSLYFRTPKFLNLQNIF